MLNPMPDPEAERYVERSVVLFANDLARAQDVPVDKALADSRALVGRILPDGPRTPGHHFRRVVADGVEVGRLWFAEELDQEPPRVYLFDVTIDEDRRGRGHGTAALAALEEEARRVGAAELMLSVFHHNTGAVRLYERLGFVATERDKGGMRMSKELRGTT